MDSRIRIGVRVEWCAEHKFSYMAGTITEILLDDSFDVTWLEDGRTLNYNDRDLTENGGNMSFRYEVPTSRLIEGAPLILEDLDLQGIGMYSQEQKDKLLAEGVPEGDFFLKTLAGTTMWARKTDEGKKWHIFSETELKLHKVIKDV